MSYAYFFVGKARLPAAAVETWRGTSVRDVELTSVADEAWGLEASGHFDTVGEVLDEVAKWYDGKVEIGPNVRVFAVASKDEDPWLTYRGDVVAAFVALAQVGGEGQLEVVATEDGPDAGFRIETDGDGATFEDLDEDEIWAARARGPGEDA